MRKYLLFLIFTVAMIGITTPASAVEKPANYVVIKAGLYSPSDEYDLDNFNGNGSITELDSKTGFDGEIAVGHYFLPFFAMELGAGYFESKGSPAAEPGKTKLKVVPVIVSAKALLPIGAIEPYAEFGIGAYFTELKVSANIGDFDGSSKVTYGLHGGVGVNFNVTDVIFVGVEGRYLWAKPSYGGQGINLDGFTTTACLGLRF